MLAAERERQASTRPAADSSCRDDQTRQLEEIGLQTAAVPGVGWVLAAATTAAGWLAAWSVTRPGYQTSAALLLFSI
ncbi:MAG: hypothetical protein ACRC35_11605 [Angustibacter sp.]